MSEEVDIEIRLLKIKVAVLVISAAIAFTVIGYGFSSSNEEKTFCGGVIEEPRAYCGTVSMNTKASKIFRANCAACHSIGSNRVVAAGLEGCFDRFPYNGWFRDYMLNQDSLIKAKEPYTLKLKDKFQMNFIHRFDHLTIEDIKELETYLGKLN